MHSNINLSSIILTGTFKKIIEDHMEDLTYRILSGGAWVFNYYVSPSYISVSIIAAACMYLGRTIKHRLRASSTEAKQRRRRRRNQRWSVKNLSRIRKYRQATQLQVPNTSESEDEELKNNDGIETSAVTKVQGRGDYRNLPEVGETSSCRSTPELFTTTVSREVSSSDFSDEDVPKKIQVKRHPVRNLSRTRKYRKTTQERVPNISEDEDEDLKLIGVETSGVTTGQELGDYMKLSEVGETSSCSSTSERFTTTVGREASSSDSSDEDVPKKIQGKRHQRPRKNLRWKQPERRVKAVIRKTRSGRIYNFGLDWEE